ncbi:MAG: phosphoribosylanthranilate isomerase [Syntrophomonadaceae bacterium]|nr:phosphoribosylanthranilate isomerase [Syntrophomonadaceae bacterium]
MVWIKICGITNLPDALAATALGADAAGFVFAAGKRQVKPEVVRMIVQNLPPRVAKVGVFVNKKISLVREIADFCGLTAIQLHGEESAAYCSLLRGYEVIKAFRIQDNLPEGQMRDYLQKQVVQKILLDTYLPDQLGGTGKTFDWKLAARQEWLQLPVIIAGGLNPENISEALQIAQPFGVDVSSGVEKAPGQKDFFKLKTFIENARGL